MAGDLDLAHALDFDLSNEFRVAVYKGFDNARGGRFADAVGDVDGEEITRCEEALKVLQIDVIGVAEIRLVPGAVFYGSFDGSAGLGRLGTDDDVFAVRLIPNRCYFEASLSGLFECGELGFGFVSESVAYTEGVLGEVVLGGHGRSTIISLRRNVAMRGEMDVMSWLIWSLLSAFFAAITAVFAKLGVAHVDSNLATAIRTSVVVVFAWAIALSFRAHGGLASLDRRSWIFLTASGLGTGLSWICYFRALSLGPASKVAPIDKLSVVFVIALAWPILGETINAWKLVGGLLISAGAILLAYA